jgi:mycothiol synthase
MTPPFPNDLRVRAPVMADLEAVTALLDAYDIAAYGAADNTVEEVLAEWQGPRFTLAADAWVVVAPGGQIIGYAEMPASEPTQIHSYARVHPAHRGRGIGTRLVQLVEARARQLAAAAPPGAPVTIANGIFSVDDAARRLLEQRGYTPVRHFWRMAIELDHAPPAPVWPTGIAARTFVLGQDERAVFAAVDEAFADHWRHTPADFAEWVQRRTGRAGFDPTLWFLATASDALAGAALCRYQRDSGWVSQLAVRRPWRQRGLGMALLRQSLSEFYRRGTRTVGLGVDAHNLTGATRLYERAGMHVARQLDLYEKELPAGDSSM